MKSILKSIIKTVYLYHSEMTKIAPVVKDTFYVSKKFAEKDSINSLASDSFKSNISMNSNNHANSSLGSRGSA